MFDEEVVKGLEDSRISGPSKGRRGGSTPQFIFDKRGVPHMSQDFQRKLGNHQRTYAPPSNAHKGE